MFIRPSPPPVPMIVACWTSPESMICTVLTGHAAVSHIVPLQNEQQHFDAVHLRHLLQRQLGNIALEIIENAFGYLRQVGLRPALHFDDRRTHAVSSLSHFISRLVFAARVRDALNSAAACRRKKETITNRTTDLFTAWLSFPPPSTAGKSGISRSQSAAPECCRPGGTARGGPRRHWHP